MKSIPTIAAQKIAHTYGYDQVAIVARKVGEDPDPHGEHVTTYGVTPDHCTVAARIGSTLKHFLMGWPSPLADAPKVRGVGRMEDNDKALLLLLDRRPSDHELRVIHDYLNGKA